LFAAFELPVLNPRTNLGPSAMTAFRESVEAMIPALRRYTRALTRGADVADDLVQDTLVRARHFLEIQRVRRTSK
jgi:DNA-directed RNA polymerase specialized sigma24 family protein